MGQVFWTFVFSRNGSRIVRLTWNFVQLAQNLEPDLAKSTKTWIDTAKNSKMKKNCLLKYRFGINLGAIWYRSGDDLGSIWGRSGVHWDPRTLFKMGSRSRRSRARGHAHTWNEWLASCARLPWDTCFVVFWYSLLVLSLFSVSRVLFQALCLLYCLHVLFVRSVFLVVRPPS